VVAGDLDIGVGGMMINTKYM
jgi:hypothetical protein